MCLLLSGPNLINIQQLRIFGVFSSFNLTHVLLVTRGLEMILRHMTSSCRAGGQARRMGAGQLHQVKYVEG